MEVVSGQGKIRISNDVIMLIAKKSVEEVDGVVSFSGGLPVGITEFFSKNTATKKGVKIKNEETQVVINLSVVVKYGVIIPEVIKAVQGKVKKSIEAMTDIEVGKVNVFVQDIQL
ncbi:Asp23/Gls24 family envelope stress response protein [Alkaliphilus sp. B6464]|uniref:Asp23/Gls24 family envelope stress response protein n=1 Tax=Alkaliphilus sp. B6464 TaxID=2731219 RepID=UPI001BA74277|nr:Asp23/Gls24 family envelope stress response protein [Alkaliphilus sp. B6464]QUH20104.1 Asp23/Gls24 family envelope stress response protein [Alkaliphilus sp. B6464]